jgi:HK97 family phage prohead protease
MALGDRLRAVFGMGPRRLQLTAETSPRPIDDMIHELMDGIGRVSRRDALSVPAVKRGRDLICGIANLPLETIDATRRPVQVPLLEQLDENTTNVAVLAMLFEDLLFESVSYLLVTARDDDDFPTKVRHVDVSQVTTRPPDGLAHVHPLASGLDPRDVIWVEGRAVSKRDVKRFDSPNTPLLRDGSRAIKRAVALDKAAELFAENPRPQDFFTPADPNADPGDDDAIAEALSKWAFWRRRRVTGYVPAALKYNQVQQPTPVDLQLVQLQERASLDIAISIGLNPNDVGVNVTTRTYANIVDARQDRINEVLAPYMAAVTQRLSMGDITRPGQKVLFDLDDYLKADPKTRSEVQIAYLAAGVVDIDEIREEEGLSKQTRRPVIQATVGRPVAAIEADGMPRVRFARETGLTFDDAVDAAFAVDEGARELVGMAVPYGQTARKGGRRYRFAPGSLKYASVSRVKLLRDHDNSQPLGRAIKLTETAEGLVATFKVARGKAGDDALALAADGVLDGLSVGVDFRDEDLRPDPLNPGALLVLSAALREISLLAVPAFDDSRLTSVRASDDGRTGMDPDTTTTPATEPAPANPVHFTAEQIAALMNGGLNLGVQPAAEPARPTFVDPAPAGRVEVTEPASYRFDRDGNLQPAAYDFGVDMIRGLNQKFNDPAARQRAEAFVSEQFAVITTDVNELNPTVNQNRYIDQREYRSPVWDRINKGAPPNGVQPFSWPSFSSASGLVGAHTEGTEPSSGSYVTTNQTVTPTATSGKAKISRETWDMGGTPGIGNLIWRQMTRGYTEALEAKAVAVLDAATPTGITLTTGGGTTGQTLAKEIIQAFAKLQFVRGGFSMDSLFSQIDLYLALISAQTTDGAYLFPALGPANRDGTVRQRFGAIDINGVVAVPSWALAATGTVAASSYLFDSGSVDGWATPPRQLLMPEIEVANVYVGIWGYSAAAINDIAGVRELIYDPA